MEHGVWEPHPRHQWFRGSDNGVLFRPRVENVRSDAIYVEGNVGLFTYDWDASNVITGMKVAIAADLSGDELVHFVLEETTQAMGLINDVEDPRSIFDGGTGRATAYSSLDREVIELHCSTSVKPGMQASDIS